MLDLRRIGDLQAKRGYRCLLTTDVTIYRLGRL